MKKAASIAALLFYCFAGLLIAYQNSWTGKLVSAECTQIPQQPEQPPKSCDATQATTQFGVQTQDGKVYKFDPEGNVKTATAMRGFPDATGPMVKITGRITEDGILRVDAIEIH